MLNNMNIKDYYNRFCNSKIGKILKIMWKDPVWSKIISFGIIALLTFMTNSFTKGAFIKSICSLLNREIALYWVLLVFLGIWLINIMLKYFKKKKKPRYYSYKEDTICNQKYRWDYDKSGRIICLFVICPKCHIRMIPTIDRYSGSQMEYNCPQCDHKISGSEFKDEYKIQTIISEKIKNLYDTR